MPHRSVVTLTGDKMIDAAPDTDYFYVLAAGVTAVALPTAVDNTCRYTVKNITESTVALSASTGQLIEGAAHFALAAGAATGIISDGSNWWVV